MNKEVDEEFKYIHDEYILQCTCTEMKDKIDNLQSKIDKAIEVLNKKYEEDKEIFKSDYDFKFILDFEEDLLNILKEVENVKNN